MKRKLALAIALAFALKAGATIQIGTGLDALGNLRGNGASEINYAVSGLSSSATVGYLASSWVANQTSGQWIVPNNQGGGITKYIRNISGTGTISGRFSSDNPGELLVNGHVVAAGLGWPGSDQSDYTRWISFTYVLDQAVNTIEFDVNNLGGPSGLIVVGTFTPTVNAVPEPATVLAGLMLFLPFGASLIRNWRRLGVNGQGRAR